MIYFDYSATTPINKNVLKKYTTNAINYIGNPNSNHILGKIASDKINSATKEIAELLRIKKEQIIYTSGASEANNLAIKGFISSLNTSKKHIITTYLEHSSVIGPISFLAQNGCDVDFVNLTSDGLVDLEHLASLIRKDTVLVSICAVNSEVGIVQDLKAINKLLKKYPQIIFHSDMTQLLGKDKVELSLVDMASFSAHKIYGPVGVGMLYKADRVKLIPQIHGGKSTTVYRSGTPSLPLITALAEAIKMTINSLTINYDHVLASKQYLIDQFAKNKNIIINSNDKCLPHILNISVMGMASADIQKFLENKAIYVSTQTACSSDAKSSAVILKLTDDKERARSSIRISLSPLTKKYELISLVKALKELSNKCK